MSEANIPPEILEQKNKQRLALRKEYLKLLTDPHNAQGGVIFDPAMQRYLSMRAKRIDYFKETPTSVWRGFSIVIIPMALIWYYTYNARNKREAELRSGKVSYRDRWHKFV